MKLKTDKNKGFSLVETILYIAIFSMVAAAFISFIMSVINSKEKVYAAQEVHSNNRTALNLISRSIRSADDVITPDAGTSSSTLELDMPAPAPDIVFKAVNGTLYMEEAGSGALPVTSNEINVTELNFINYSAGGPRENIKIYLSAEYRYRGSEEYEYGQSLETAVSTRK